MELEASMTILGFDLDDRVLLRLVAIDSGVGAILINSNSTFLEGFVGIPTIGVGILLDISTAQI